MARDEVRGRQKRSGGGSFKGPTGARMTNERARDRESRTGRAGGTGRIVQPEEEDVPRKTPGIHSGKKQLDEGGI